MRSCAAGWRQNGARFGDGATRGARLPLRPRRAPGQRPGAPPQRRRRRAQCSSTFTMSTCSVVPCSAAAARMASTASRLSHTRAHHASGRATRTGSSRAPSPYPASVLDGPYRERGDPRSSPSVADLPDDGCGHASGPGPQWPCSPARGRVRPPVLIPNVARRLAVSEEAHVLDGAHVEVFWARCAPPVVRIVLPRGEARPHKRQA